MNRNTFKKLSLWAMVVMLAACSTQRNTRMSRAYHNLTAHYNVFFNGNESFKKGEATTVGNTKNDYTKLLPVFEYSNPENTRSASADMDRAIDKGTILISKHSITKKPAKKGSSGDQYYKAFYDQKEFNKWVDDAYLLIGKAHFYKQEYDVAIRTFDHVIRDFPNTPSRFEATLWKAAAYSERGDYTNAKLTLESYDTEGTPPNSLYGKYMAIYADMLLKQKRYDDAIPYLKGAITSARKKTQKLRFTYILAQTYLLSQKPALAQVTFNEVIKLRPPYEMAINASVNSISIVTENSNTAQIKRDIAKLLKNKKNIDYRDRIFFALSMVNLAEKDVPSALKSLKQSTQASKDNDQQKAASFLKMGDIYYSIPKYKQAYMAYDSAMLYLPKTDEAYNDMSIKHSSLQELVGHVDKKEREDSLQLLAQMSPYDRNAAIERIVQHAKKQAEELAKEKELNQPNNDYYFLQNNAQNNTQQGGKWYFYNLTSVGMGKAEFERKWGKRKLEDNWRRTNKAAVTQTDENSFGEPEMGPDGLPANPSEKAIRKSPNDSTVINNALGKQEGVPTVDELLRDIPLNADQLAKSNATINDALMGMALVYRDKLLDVPLAVEALNTLLARQLPDNEKEEVLIELFRCYELLADNDGLARVRKMLVDQFPNGKFTAYANDPHYFEKAEALLKQQSDEYEATYVNYLSGFHSSVIDKAHEVETNQPDNPLMPKYRLLESLAYAREGMADPFKNTLEVLVNKHPNTPESELAKAFLDQLSKGRMPVKSVAQQTVVLAAESNYTKITLEKPSSQFVAEPSSPHSFVVWIPAEADVKRLKFNLADYNFGNYIVRDFDLNVRQLPDKSQLLEVKGFNNQAEVLEYFYAIRQNPELFMVPGIGKPYMVSISASNLKYVISSGDIKSYFPFFIQLYLRGMKTLEPMSEQEFSDAMGNLLPAEVDLKKLEEQKAKETVEAQPEGYAPQEGEHWFMLTYNATGVNATKLKSTFAAFIRNQQPNKTLLVEVVPFKAPLSLLVVKGFESKAEAEAFAGLVAKNPFTTNDVRSKKPAIFVIAPANYDYLMKTGDIEEYKQFINKK